MTPKAQGFIWGVAFGIVAYHFYTKSGTAKAA